MTNSEVQSGRETNSSSLELFFLKNEKNLTCDKIMKIK